MKTTLTSADQSGWYLCTHKSCGYEDFFHWKDGIGTFLSRAITESCYYTNFRRLFTESDVATLNEELRTLRDELSRLKSQPYEMRRADKPDCVGVWMSVDGDVYSIPMEVQLQNYTRRGPYHYLGPIPVVVEQQPPKVVTINYQGKNMRAIPSDNPEYWTLLGDNGTTCGVAIGKFEEVQS